MCTLSPDKRTIRNGTRNKRVIFTTVSVPIYYRRAMRASARARASATSNSRHRATGPFPVGHYTISRADEQQHTAAEFISASCILSQRNQVSRRPPLAAASTSLFSRFSPTNERANTLAAAAQHPHDFHFSLSSRARGAPQSYGEPFIRVICHADPASRAGVLPVYVSFPPPESIPPYLRRARSYIVPLARAVPQQKPRGVVLSPDRLARTYK